MYIFNTSRFKRILQFFNKYMSFNICVFYALSQVRLEFVFMISLGGKRNVCQANGKNICGLLPIQKYSATGSIKIKENTVFINIKGESNTTNEM